MAISRGPRIVKDGLVLALDAADKNSYPGSGSTWYDLSGNGNHGTLTNGPTFDGNNGGSIVFDGTNDYVNFSINSSIFSSEATICIFLKRVVATPSSQGETGLMTFSVIDNAESTSYYPASHYPWTDGIGYFSVFRGTRINSINLSTSNVNREIPHQISFTTTPGSNGWKFYQNTKLVYQTTGEDTVNLTDCRIGSSVQIINGSQNYYYYFPGNIYSIKLYNRSLSAAEIQQNYNATKGRFNL